MFFGIGSLPLWLCGLPLIIGLTVLGNKKYSLCNIFKRLSKINKISVVVIIISLLAVAWVKTYLSLI